MKLPVLLFSISIAITRSLNQNIRYFIINRQGNICGLCKTKFSRMVPHEIHHLNHNSTDNDPNNLLALCSNCHSAHHRYCVHVYPYFDNNTK
jgi:5-methylcytosine-specific restriction endonuclease McrA